MFSIYNLLLFLLNIVFLSEIGIFSFRKKEDVFNLIYIDKIFISEYLSKLGSKAHHDVKLLFHKKERIFYSLEQYHK